MPSKLASGNIKVGKRKKHNSRFTIWQVTRAWMSDDHWSMNNKQRCYTCGHVQCKILTDQIPFRFLAVLGCNSFWTAGCDPTTPVPSTYIRHPIQGSFKTIQSKRLLKDNLSDIFESQTRNFFSFRPFRRTSSFTKNLSIMSMNCFFKKHWDSQHLYRQIIYYNNIILFIVCASLSC